MDSDTLTEDAVVDADSRLLQNNRINGAHHKCNLAAEQHPGVDLKYVPTYRALGSDSHAGYAGHDAA